MTSDHLQIARLQSDDGDLLAEMSPPSLPRVAILMATYAGDNPGHLAAALRTIFDQTYPARLVRIYLALDGPLPPPNRAVIDAALRRHGESRLCVVPLPRNCGLAAALNEAALQLGDQEFVVRADADDLSEPDRISAQVTAMLADPRIGILGTSIAEFSEDSRVLGVRSFPPADQVRTYLAFACPLAHPSVCFRRSAWDRLGGYRSVHFNEDLDMWFRAAALDIRIDNLQDALVRFRLSPGLVGRRSWPKAFTEFRCYMHGIHTLFGWNWRLILPLPRLLVRLMPAPITSFLYLGSSIRRRLLNASQR